MDRTLFDPPPAQYSSPTSVRAAQAIRPDANRLRAVVLEYLRGRGQEGATRQEIEDGTGLVGDCVRPRCWEMLKARTRRTRSGREAAVLVVV